MNARRGLSRIEFLVVILIIVILIGLLVPPVSRVGHAARRAQCQNNLKQIVVALHNYQGAHGDFPSGTAAAPQLSPEARLSWLAMILPFIEEEPLAKKLKWDEPWNAEQNRAVGETVIRTLWCPAHPSSGDVGQAHTHYVGLTGLGPESALLDKHSPLAGFFGYERQIRRIDIKDGDSCTAAVIETSADNGPWAAGGHATLRALALEETMYLHENGPFGIKHKADSFFRSNPVTANTAFADGSVRSIPSEISPAVLRALVTIAGGEQSHGDF